MRRLDIANVSHRFAKTLAVDDVSLGVEAGELVCLLGPSGCGKTTLLRLVAGLETLQAGRIAIGDRPMAIGGQRHQVPPEQRGVGLMFQDYALFPHLTVAQNIGFGLSAAARADGRIERALDDVHLAHLRQRYPHTLSGGQQQRIALLRALAPEPGVLLLDEPFSGLDVYLRQRLRREARAMLAASGAATLLVTHDAEEAMFLADRIVVLDHGRVAQDAAPMDIYARPANPFIARLFGQANEFLGVVRGGVVATALGPVPATGLADAAPALCLVRAEGVEVAADGGSGDGYVRARVETARPLGPASQLLLKPLAEGVQEEPPPLVEARLSGTRVPAEGSEVRMRPRAEHTFVFPGDG